MTHPLLQIQNLEKSFDGTQVLKGISLDIMPGEFVTLLGPSGCGKTTTLRIIAGLLEPDSGKVMLDGQDITAFPPNKRGVNTVFQNYALFPHMNVEKNIAYGLKIAGVPKDERKKRVGEMLELVKLAGYEKRMPAQLSGGQRQRVAIARAVILNPRMLLLDEPLGALDLKLRQQMQQELKEIQLRLGIAFLYITHDQEEALNMSDRICIMSEGQFEQIGTPEEIYEKPKTTFAARFIGQGALFEGVVTSCKGSVCRVNVGNEEVLARADEAYQPGDAVTVSVHAERIRMENSDWGLSAKVLRHRFAGSTLRTELLLDSGREITVLTAGMLTDLPQEGSHVKICWDARHAALIRRGGGK